MIAVVEGYTMAKRGHELDLSLTGSQVLSARSTKSVSKRPSSSGGRLSDSKLNRHSERQASNSNNSTPRVTSHKIVNGSNQTVPLTRGVSNEFLALFESQGAKPKVRSDRTPTVKKPLKAVTPVEMSRSSAFPGSLENTPRSARSKLTNTTASDHTRHSIFRADSPLSVITLDDQTPQQSARTARSSLSVADRIASAATTPRGDNTEFMNNGLPIETPKSPNSWVDDDTDVGLSSRLTQEQPNHKQNPPSRASTSDQKSLNAANNMLPEQQEFKKPPKLELRAMRNSYQNATYNVNKTPVNELHQYFTQNRQSGTSKNLAEDYIKRVNMAACVIQHSFRRYVRQKKALRASEAAMKRMLTQKKEELEKKQADMRRTTESAEAERQRKREERARQARHAAIEELNKRREEEAQKAKAVAEEELAALKAAGKVGQKKYVTKSISQRTKAATKTEKDSSYNKDSPRRGRLGEDNPECKDTKLELQSPRSEGKGRPENAEDAEAVPVTPSHAGTKTTLDDLMNTLKLLEEDEQLPPVPESRITAWLEQGNEPTGSDHSQNALTAENVELLNKQEKPVDNRLKNILSFLDEVETKDKLDAIDQHGLAQVSAVNLPEVDFPGLTVPSAEELEHMEQASATASEVTSTVLQQRLQLEEKNRRVQMLQQALNQQRELTIRHAKETEKEMNKRLDVQKSEYEETVQRHLNFIDQLIDDKKSLGEKCEALVTEMKSLEKKSSEKIRSMQDTHDRELAKVKEMIIAQEKVKREKWIEEKTKKIKDLTVKGLEPEIQRLIAKHKSELKKLKAIHEAELLQSDERAGQRYVSMTEELRDQLAKEKEAACQREREQAAKRYEKQLQAEEESYQQARRRLYQEIQDEKERVAQQAARQRQEMDRLQRQLEDSHTSSSDMMKKEYEKAREEQERRHKAEMTELRERMTIEKESWEQNYMKKQESWLIAKERELKESVRQERDKEIELVIGRLEEDGVQAREECERAAESRIKRIREKYEGEMEELEKSERQAMEKYNQMKAELLEYQGELERLKVVVRQKEQEVDDTKRLSEKLHRERDHVQDVVRQEFADKLVATDEENKRLKQEMAELKSRHKVEIERMKQDIEVVNKSKQEEMDAIHSRVKEAISKKEEVINQIKQQYQAALKRADHLESLLEQQRKQILSSKK